MENTKEIDENQKERKEPIFLCLKLKKIKKWTKEEDELLINEAKRLNHHNWKEISKSFQDKTAIQCSARFKRIKPELKKGQWTSNEDKLLLDLIKIHGKKWCAISRFMKTRTGKQIRDRYFNCLNPEINKKRFSEEEELLIINLYKKLGPSWSEISKYFTGRTSDLIKNRFYSSIQYRLKDDKRLCFKKITKETNNFSNYKDKHNGIETDTNRKRNIFYSLKHNLNDSLIKANLNIKRQRKGKYNFKNVSSFNSEKKIENYIEEIAELKIRKRKYLKSTNKNFTIIDYCDKVEESKICLNEKSIDLGKITNENTGSNKIEIKSDFPILPTSFEDLFYNFIPSHNSFEISNNLLTLSMSDNSIFNLPELYNFEIDFNIEKKINQLNEEQEKSKQCI